MLVQCMQLRVVPFLAYNSILHFICYARKCLGGSLRGQEVWNILSKAWKLVLSANVVDPYITCRTELAQLHMVMVWCVRLRRFCKCLL
jgi:hypothetical protein